jgi:diacylglycerol kinase family enzyme
MRDKLLILVNPSAGRKDRRLLPRVLDLLRRAGANVSVQTPNTGAEARRIAAEAAAGGNYDAIIAAGGDGTLRNVAIGALGTTTPVGVIPLGNANVLAQEIHLKVRAEDIARRLLTGEAAEMRGATANGEPFFLMAGAGFDGRVCAGLNRSLQNRLGNLAYVPPIAKALLRSRDDIEVRVDGKTFRAGWVVVSRARHYGGAFDLVPGAGVLEDGLNAVLFHGRGAPVRIGQLLSLAVGRLDRRKDVQIIPCRKVEINAAQPVPVEIDGDPYGTSPLSIEPHPLTVRLIAGAA